MVLVAKRSERGVSGAGRRELSDQRRAAPAGVGAGQHHGTEKFPWAKKLPEYKVVQGAGEGK